MPSKSARDRSHPDAPRRPQRPHPGLPQVPPRRVTSTSANRSRSPATPSPTPPCRGSCWSARRPASARRSTTGRSRALAGEKLRAWFELGGIPREDFYRSVHFAAVTRCYPGRLPGAKGDRVPSPAEQALCRPWLDELIAHRSSPRSSSWSACWRSARSSARAVADGRRRHRRDPRRRPLPPLAPPLGRQPLAERAANVAAVERAMLVLRERAIG